MGILSLLAAKAGAKKVYAVEPSPIVETLRRVVKDNDMSDVITIIPCAVEDIQFLDDYTQTYTVTEAHTHTNINAQTHADTNADIKIDTIISEWMGFHLLHECMLESVIYARDRFLTQGGVMYPHTAKLCVSMFRDDEIYNRHMCVSKFDNFMGFNMSFFGQKVTESVQSKPIIDFIHAHSVDVTDTHDIVCFNLETMNVKEINEINKSFVCKIKKDGPLHGFVLWFEVGFHTHTDTDTHIQTDTGTNAETLIQTKILSTSPKCPRTHWKQSIIPVCTKPTGMAGMCVRCRLALNTYKSDQITGKNERTSTIEIAIENIKF